MGWSFPSLGLVNIVVFQVGSETGPVPLNWNKPINGRRGMAITPNRPLAFIRTSKSISFLSRSIFPSPVNFNDRVVAKKSLEKITPSRII